MVTWQQKKQWNQEECEQVVMDFMNEVCGFEPCGFKDSLGCELLDRLGVSRDSCTIQLNSFEHGTDYFYISKWTRIS